MADPVRETPEAVLGRALHDALCSRCADVGSGLTIRSLDVERAAPAQLAALRAAGYAVVRLPGITPGAQLLPGADLRQQVSGEVVGRSLAAGTDVYEDYVGVWPGTARWLTPAEARDRAAQLLAVADAVAEPELPGCDDCPAGCTSCTGDTSSCECYVHEHVPVSERATSPADPAGGGS